LFSKFLPYCRNGVRIASSQPHGTRTQIWIHCMSV
jgi:hypothetical protein